VNLIKDKWIPVRRADGTPDTIAPFEIGASDNPVVDIAAPRPDFRGALYQFLIGLVQTAFAPEDDDEWEEKWKKVPKCEELRKAFEMFSEAFELDAENGPAFMQDYSMKTEEKPIHAKQLLFEIAGNPEYFVKHSAINILCQNCAATALFSLQTNAPEGGRGHRTGMRGGGPLTTLISLENRHCSLWEKIWLNILTLDERFSKVAAKTQSTIFPWMGPTRISTNDVKTYPEDVNELQMYWGLPRRIRLVRGRKNQTCDICGSQCQEIAGFNMECYGVCYSGTWEHVLSPYRRQKEKDGSISLIAIKGKQGSSSYPNWLSLTLGNNTNESAAPVVRSFIEHKVFIIANAGHPQVWCFGHDMKQMKARCWYEHTMPIIILSKEKKPSFIEGITKLIAAAEDVSKLLREHVKSAWFSRPKDAKGDTFFISNSFLVETESAFYSITEQLRAAIESDKPTAPLLSDWRNTIIAAAETLFDRFALNSTDEPRNMKRIALAARALSAILKSEKTKSINALKEAV
jgi:CRISPR system Cascade subunit CasA